MRSRSRGFTLIELMIVVAILSILAVLAIPAYNGYITTARQGMSRGNIEALRIAVEDYRLDNMAAGYLALDGLTYDPGGAQTLRTGVLGWTPDGDRDEFIYTIAATATNFTITVTPVGHAADAQTFSK